jgi:hypothetical protein
MPDTMSVGLKGDDAIAEIIFPARTLESFRHDQPTSHRA